MIDIICPLCLKLIRNGCLLMFTPLVHNPKMFIDSESKSLVFCLLYGSAAKLNNSFTQEEDDNKSKGRSLPKSNPDNSSLV